MSSGHETKEERIKQKLKALILQFVDKIIRNIDIKSSDILEIHISNIVKHEGAGGTTYIVQCVLETRIGEMVEGGIVLKFANDLESEVRNAKLLNKVLSYRQAQWEQYYADHDFNKRYCSLVFSPKVIHVVPDVKALILEFLGDFTPLMKISSLSQEEKWGYMGYALARLHGHEVRKVNIQLYKPLFKVLSKVINNEYLDFWAEVLKGSRGGVEFIHGDSHLSNILVGNNPRSLAWIDAMMLPNMERMDDVSYALSHLIQDHVARESTKRLIDTESFIGQICWKWVPSFLSIYKKTFDISKLYTKYFPLDFFLGSHLIIRAGLWEAPINNYLMNLGRYFIERMPISSMLSS